MKIIRTLAVGAAAVAAAALASTALAGTAAGAKVVPFTGSYAGPAVVKVTDNVADISATGSGTASLVGASKVAGTGTGDTTVQPCVPWGGTGTITGTKGTLTFKMASGTQGCGDEAGSLFSIVGRASVVKGTGVFKKAKGTFKVTGSYDRGKGAFAVKFNGKLTV
jgi:hypothetical protein